MKTINHNLTTLLKFNWAELTLAVLMIASVGYGIWGYALLNNNEGLYAGIAADMARGGEWIIPHANGVPYIEKPPLLYWLTALSLKVWGYHEGGARFAVVLAGLMTIIALYRLVWAATGSRIYSWLAAWILATSIGFMVLSRMIIFDGWLGCSLAWALYYNFLALMGQDEAKHWRKMCVVLGLGVLIKGLVLLILVGLIVIVAWRHQWRRLLKLLFDPWGAGWFIIIAVPWHVAAAWRDPDFLWFYFVNEHLLRFLDLRQPRDYYTGPIYYYVPRLLGMLLPWSWLLLCGRWWRRANDFKAAEATSPGWRSLREFAIIWLGVLMVFFSLSRAKANYYLLPAMPAAAILLAQIGLYGLTRQQQRWFSVVAVSILLLGTGGIIWYLRRYYPAGEIWPLIVSGLGLIGLLVGCSWQLFATKSYDGESSHLIPWSLGAPGLASLMLLMGVVTAAGDYSQLFSSRSLVQAVPYNTNLFVYKDFENISALSFYHHPHVIIINSGSHDLAYGQQRRPLAAQFITDTEWREYLNRRQPIYVIVHRRFYQRFYANFAEYQWRVVSATAHESLLVRDG